MHAHVLAVEPFVAAAVLTVLLRLPHSRALLQSPQAYSTALIQAGHSLLPLTPGAARSSELLNVRLQCSPP